MSFKQLFLVCLVIISVNCQDVTFDNVVVKGYSMYTLKFNYTIKASNTLKETLPKNQVFDHIEITNSHIPVLKKDSISDIDILDELTLDNDQIKNLDPGCFKNVPQLRKLTIKNNKISVIKEGVFNNLNVGSLELSNNGIERIESGAFDNMPELLNIMLADNKINKWNSAWFANTPLLSRVSVQNNQIDELPANAFVHLKGEKMFGTVPLTINIILSHNRISKVDKETFNGLDKINNLWLDYNQLNNWSEDLLTNIQVKELRLDQNNLNCLSGDFNKIFQAENTYLDGNPWDCGCLKNIQQWKKEKRGKDVHIFYSSLTCDANRIEQKVTKLKDLLAELKKNRTQLNDETAD